MKLSDAKKILSGKYSVISAESLALQMQKKGGWFVVGVEVSKLDMEFMLRQLALKVTGEKD
jgi:hypothetical protein